MRYFQRFKKRFNKLLHYIACSWRINRFENGQLQRIRNDFPCDLGTISLITFYFMWYKEVLNKTSPCGGTKNHEHYYFKVLHVQHTIIITKKASLVIIMSYPCMHFYGKVACNLFEFGLRFVSDSSIQNISYQSERQQLLT